MGILKITALSDAMRPALSLTSAPCLAVAPAKVPVFDNVLQVRRTESLQRTNFCNFSGWCQMRICSDARDPVTKKILRSDPDRYPHMHSPSITPANMFHLPSPSCKPMSHFTILTPNGPTGVQALSLPGAA